MARASGTSACVTLVTLVTRATRDSSVLVTVQDVAIVWRVCYRYLTLLLDSFTLFITFYLMIYVMYHPIKNESLQLNQIEIFDSDISNSTL